MTDPNMEAGGMYEKAPPESHPSYMYYVRGAMVSPLVTRKLSSISSDSEFLS